MAINSQVTCNHLIIAIGLCVDYSAHIAHRFLVERGTRDERAVATLENIGPAVLNGGVREDRTDMTSTLVPLRGHAQKKSAEGVTQILKYSKAGCMILIQQA